jgi:1-deoxy-D-xylulose-5-phosphate synthase
MRSLKKLLQEIHLVPRMAVMAPADENELQHMLRTAIRFQGPISIRYPRGIGVGVTLDPQPQELPIGKGVRLKDGSDVTILAIGNRVHPSLEAAQLLEDRGISCGVVNMRFVKPLDVELLKECAAKTPRLVTVEDNVLQGGFGSAVLEALTPGRAEVLRLGLPDDYVEHGAPHLLYDLVGLSAPKIAEQIAAWVPAKNAVRA